MSESRRPDPTPSAWGFVAVAGSLAFLVSGIFWPGVAAALLRILLASLALGWVAARALAGDVPAKMVQDTYSPFDGDPDDRPPPPVPDVVRRRARMLRTVDDPHGGAQRPIPWPVALGLAREAKRRLEQGHGLRLGSPADASQIRHMVSDVTWTFLSRGDPAVTSEADTPDKWTIPLARLDDILDDLERL